MTEQEFKSLKYGDVLNNEYRELIVQGFIGDVVICIDDNISGGWYTLHDLTKHDYEIEGFVKPDVIDWNKPQLVSSLDCVVLTTGKHNGSLFE
jgi:hypothetical protein